MARTVNCIKLGREAEGLDFPPYPGELGKRIYESVSKEAWAAWLKQQTMLVNENRLNLADLRARQYLARQMEKHFFGERADGVPHSPRFSDIYHTESGALAQARHVFLGGCGLPAAWANRPQWRILETGFGFGLNFLTTWQAWRSDPQRPRLLHVVSIEAFPVSRDDLLRAAQGYP